MYSIVKRVWNSIFHINDSFKINRKIIFKEIIEKHIRKSGIWFINNSSEIKWIVKISILSFFVTNITQFVALFMAKGDPKKLLSCFSVFTFCAMGFLKLSSLLIYQKRWRCLLNKASSVESYYLKRNETQNENESEEENSFICDHINSYTKQFHNVSTNLSRVYNFTAIIYMVSPFIEYGIQIYSGNNDHKYPHILQGWAPLDFNIFGYFVTIVTEAVAAIYCVIIHKTFDLTAIGLMIFIRGQFALLHDLSSRIGGKGNHLFLSKRRDERAHGRIKECHKIHLALLRSLKDLGEFVQNILGIYFFVATLTLCSVAVQLQWKHLSTTQLISLLQYMCANLTQLFLFCHYGDAVSYQSSVSLGEGPFCAASWCLSAKIRRELVILCIGMSQPRRIFAGPFNTLDLHSFIQIVRAAYSIYAVLRSSSSG